MVPTVAVVGKRGAGKTFVIERMVSELKRRGYRVAAVKHSAHDFDLDQEGKDSWHYAQAGSDAVVISSPRKLAVIRTVDRDLHLAEVSRFIGLDFDIILAEGFKQDKGPKIEVHRGELGSDLVCKQEQLMAVATDERLELNVPQYSPDDAAGLVDLIEKTFLTEDREEAIALFVNGEPVPLNIFVRNIFSNILSGMVSSLKRVPEASRIDISIRRKAAE